MSNPSELERTCEQNVENVPTSEAGSYVPKTDLGRKLLALREAAIKDGMKLLTVDEIMQEIRYRRGQEEDGME